MPVTVVAWLLLLASGAAAPSQPHARLLAQQGVTPTTGRPCADGCTAKGNCNVELGMCECPIGMAGPTCDEPLMPACQASPEDLPFWGVFQPKNCECYKQAAKLFNCTPGRQKTCQLSVYQARLSGSRCYLFDGKPESEQWSNFPAEGTPGVSWHAFNEDFSLRSITETEGRKAVNMWGHDKCIPQPLSACPQNCSGRGVCLKGCFPDENPPRPAWCECHKGFVGASCETAEMRPCPNECSGRGTCSRGFCHCIPPSFGTDCSRSKAMVAMVNVNLHPSSAFHGYVVVTAAYVPTEGYPARPDNIPTRKKPVIYMYELPQTVSAPVELDDNLPDYVDIYSSYLRFMDIFLKDWAVRTEDPWEANLFYIPAHTYSYSSNVGDPTPHLERVIRYVQETYPFFNRSNGKDHFMWFTGDHGACNAPADAGNIIKLVHFGYHKNQRIQGPSQMGRQPGDPTHGCYMVQRDIVAAPYNDLGLQDAEPTYKEILASQGRAPYRTNLFFFAGGVRAHNPHYSGGVRQSIATMLKEAMNASNVNTSDIVFIEGNTDKYRQLYNTTKFCLAPHGSGFGIRLSIAMVHGCIPVVIQDHVYQPYEDIIPYEEISVRVAKRDVPDLIPILRTVTEEEQAQMRVKMAEYYRAFIWEPAHGGLAYNFTISALYKRAFILWGDLYKRRRGLL